MLSVILPTYNESESLPLVLPRLRSGLKGVPHEVIIVDDDSPDETWRRAREMGEKDETIRVIRRIGRRGLSSAVIEGFLAARGDVLAVADADGQHDLSLLPALADAVRGGAGIAVGSRYAEGGSVGEWDERRHAMSRLATSLAIRLCKVRVRDPMSGFFAIHRDVFEQALPALNPKGFKILLDLLIHVPVSTTVRELPFTFGVREKGESKLSRRVQLEFIEYLYDSTLGRWIPLTLVEYCIVGAMGVAVNLIVYLLVSRLLLGETGADFLGVPLPLVTGIEAAILFNFWLNNAWTFSSARLRGLRAVTGLLTYNVACLFGALASFACTVHLYAQGVPEILSVVTGAFLGMIWNYTMSRLITWRTA